MTDHDANNAVEFERAVITSLLFDRCPIAKATVVATNADDFSHPQLAKIFAAIKALHENNAIVDIITLCDELYKRKQLEDVGGREIIYNLAQGFITTANFPAHMARVVELAKARRIRKRLADLLADPAEISETHLQAIISDAQTGAGHTQAIDRARASLEAFKGALDKQPPTLKTGLPKLDRTIEGLRIPAVSILGAAPSTGKTALAINFALEHLAAISAQQADWHDENCGVAFFSLEMSAPMILERAVAAGLKIPYPQITKRKLDIQSRIAVRDYVDLLHAQKFHVFDSERFVESQWQIVANLQPRLVIVDYVQIVRTHKRAESRRLEIDHISAMYKQMAAQNNCHILLLSQVSRLDRERANMASLKESGALEADGDYVFILKRPYVHDKKNHQPQTSEVLVDKNKFGPVGAIPLHFDGEHQRFYEADGASANPLASTSSLASAYGLASETEEDLPW